MVGIVFYRIISHLSYFLIIIVNYICSGNYLARFII